MNAVHAAPPDPLSDFARDRIPAGVAVMRLMMSRASPDDARAAVDAAADRLGAEKAREARELITDQAFLMVQKVASVADHAHAATPQDWGRAFDHVAAEAGPDAAVALYALGDPERLAAATAEVVDWLKAEGLIEPAARVLEVGCGSGRFLEALAGEVAVVLGVDVSERLCVEAARRVEGWVNVRVARVSGADLAMVADGSVDLALAIDSFPYLNNQGLAGRHLHEAARVLRPGGELVMLNWSYEDEDGAPAALAEAAGLSPVETAADFRFWDGRPFRFSRPA